MSASPSSFVLLSATGMLGTGFLESSMQRGIELGAQAIGCDAGSSDSGPFFLGTGSLSRSREALKRDLRTILVHGRSAGIPIAIGSAINAGGDPQLAVAVQLVEEIAREEGLAFRLAVVHGEIDKSWFKSAWRAGRVRPMPGVPELDEHTIDCSVRLVAQMGAEPYLRAFDQGADVVIAGRSSDAAIFAALAIAGGMPAGPSWHAGKVLECGAAPAVQRLHPDCILGRVDPQGFTVELPNRQMRCTELSVRAHGYYENHDPFHIGEPGGTIDTSNSRYTEHDGTVRVTGSRFVPSARYEVRVEGCRLAGYRAVGFAGVSDPILLDHLDEFLATSREAIEAKCAESLGARAGQDYRLVMRQYGSARALHHDPACTHSVGILWEAIAQDQAKARAIAAIAMHTALHHPVRGWHGFVSNLAIPFSPAVFEGGAVYEWTVNHLVELDTPLEPFRMESPRWVGREEADAAR